MGNAQNSLASTASKSCGTEYKLVDKSIYPVNTIFTSLRIVYWSLPITEHHWNRYKVHQWSIIMGFQQFLVNMQNR